MWFFLLFIVAPLVELYVIIVVGSHIGALNVIGLLILDALIGSWLIKYAGFRTIARFQQQVQAGKTPTREILDGLCLLLAGLLLVAPGFISDAIALLLIFPPTRALAKMWLMKRKSLGALGRVKVIRASYGGRVTDVRDVTDVDSTEVRGELDP